MLTPSTLLAVNRVFGVMRSLSIGR